MQEYLRGTKKQKGAILDSVEHLTGMHRKRIIARFRELQLRKEGVNWSEGRGRITTYTPDVTAALKDVWELSSGICAELLHPHCGMYVEEFQKKGIWRHADIATGKLLGMSMSTMKRRITSFDKILAGGGRSTTKPSDLKELIPVRRGPWKDPDPGVGEIDSVAHCGDTLVGHYAYSVQYSDVQLLWALFEAQMGKGKKETLVSIQAMRSRLPFPLVGLDPDTGSEFVNWHCYDWCEEKKIVMSRIRPGEKNDHGRIEQKNNANIRKHVGYIRIDTAERLQALRDLYEPLELFVNHFVPTTKCIKKERSNTRRTSRVYDAPATPYERVMRSSRVSEKDKEKLREVHTSLSMIDLKRQIDSAKKKLFKGAKFTKCD